MARKEHKKHVKDLLAQAIVHKTLDLERYRQVEIKRKLEEIAKIELVRRVRVSSSMNTCDEFERAIRETFLPFQGDFLKKLIEYILYEKSAFLGEFFFLF